jgi:FkbM family methyltransferase
MVLEQVEKIKSKYEIIEENIHNGILLWGAGQFGATSLEYLRKEGYNVVAFIDSSPDKQGTKIMNIEVLPPTIMNDSYLKQGIILITARHAVPEILKLFEESKIHVMAFDAWFVLKNITMYDAIQKSFVDNRSREVLSNLLLGMLTSNEMHYCSFAYDANQYFCLPMFSNCGGDYFVDAGAYVGDSIEKFIFSQNGDFKHIYAFEIGKQQLVALEKRVLRLIDEWALDKNVITVINAALGEKSGVANIKAGHHLLQTSVNFSEGRVESVYDTVPVVTLDELQIPVSFLKVDIEGSEVEMLKGAKDTIKKYKPKMAISVYHKPDDLFEIISICKQLVPEYLFSLRHHSPKLVDTTLYCWI